MVRKLVLIESMTNALLSLLTYYMILLFFGFGGENGIVAALIATMFSAGRHYLIRMLFIKIFKKNSKHY